MKFRKRDYQAVVSFDTSIHFFNFIVCTKIAGTYYPIRCKGAA